VGAVCLWGAPGVLAAQGVDATLASTQSPEQDPPEHPLVLAIHVEGARRYTREQLVGALGQTLGTPLDPDAVERGIHTLWKAFHVRAQVDLREVAGGMELLLRVSELPADLEPRFVGNDEISTDEILKWAQLVEQQELFLHQAPRVRQRILEGYRAQGYYFAEIDFLAREQAEQDSADAPADLIFEIKEGPQVRVVSVEVVGNDSMPDTGMWWWKGGLRSLSKNEISGRGPFSWWGGLLIRDTLDADLVSMRQTYRQRGWLDAVVEVGELDFNGSRDQVRITILVDEGSRYTVSSLSIVGVEQQPDPDQAGETTLVTVPLIMDEEELKSLCLLRPEDPFEAHRMLTDRTTLKNKYGELGHLSHPSLRGKGGWEFLDPVLVQDVDHHRVDVTYRLLQGRERFIREVMFTGNHHTRDSVLRRHVSVLPGERADMRELTRSLSRITSTGFYSDPRDPVGHPDPMMRFHDTDDPEMVDVEFIVQEGQVVDMQLSGGVQSDSGAFALISLRMRNFDGTDLPSSFGSTFSEVYHKEAFHGAGQLLEINLSPGSEIQSWQVRFLHPDIFGSHFDAWSLDTEFLRRDRFYPMFNEDRTRYQVKLGRAFGHDLRTYLGISKQDILIGDRAADVPGPLERQPDESRIQGLLFGLSYRDVDSRLDPRDGFIAGWHNSFNGSFMGGNHEFFRSEFILDWFRPIGGEEGGVRPGVHLGMAAGVASPFGISDEVPYTERFFIGGSKTLRGFDFRGVGPNEHSTAIGGETMLRASLEYRIPLYTVTQARTFREVEMFRMVFFVDAGILDPDAWSLDTSELRASAGVGFGLTNPIPLIFTFGWPLESGPGDDLQAFAFTISFF
jgi:outer membrane protein insertion porin family